MARPIDPTVGDGFLVVDKPAGMTSHEVVAACRRIAGTRKVGHAGTLDPMATGVLVVGVNRATRLLTYVVGADKEYTATIRLGQATVTDDAEGEVTDTAPTASVEDLLVGGGPSAAVTAGIAALTGHITQVPSSVSAIKVDGKRSYDLVRAGKDVKLAGRTVEVSRFDVLAARRTELEGGAVMVDLDVAVTVSSGTYVRALARDLGRALGVGGHLTALRRTRVGGFDLPQAHTLEQLEAARQAGAPRPEDPTDRVAQAGTSGLPLVELADAARASMAARELDAQTARRLGHGVRIDSAEPGRVGPVAAFAPDGALVAVLDESAAHVMPEVVFAPAP